MALSLNLFDTIPGDLEVNLIQQIMGQRMNIILKKKEEWPPQKKTTNKQTNKAYDYLINWQ